MASISIYSTSVTSFYSITRIVSIVHQELFSDFTCLLFVLLQGRFSPQVGLTGETDSVGFGTKKGTKCSLYRCNTSCQLQSGANKPNKPNGQRILARRKSCASWENTSASCTLQPNFLSLSFFPTSVPFLSLSSLSLPLSPMFSVSVFPYLPCLTLTLSPPTFYVYFYLFCFFLLLPKDTLRCPRLELEQQHQQTTAPDKCAP